MKRGMFCPEWVHIKFPNCMKNQKTALQLSNGALYAVYSRFLGGWSENNSGVYIFLKKSFPLLCFENHSPPPARNKAFCNLFRVFFLVDLGKLMFFKENKYILKLLKIYTPETIVKQNMELHIIG